MIATRMLLSLFLACPKPEPVATPPAAPPPLDELAQAWLDNQQRKLAPLVLEPNEAEWAANTRIVEGDDTNAQRVVEAWEAVSAITGSVETIETTRGFLEHRDELDPLVVKQLEAHLRGAAYAPQTRPDLVSRKIAAEAAHTETLYGFEFTLHGEPITPNEIDTLLAEETDLAERRAVWESSKEVGPALKEGLVELRDMRNETVQELGYDDYFAFQVADYGMESEEMLEMMDRLNREVRPLYRELHTWARYELAETYGADEVPEQLPAHWLPNRWGQGWTPMVTVEGRDLDAAFEDKSAEWIVRESEAFYVSMGFDPLPESFYTKSSLYPVPEDADHKKNTHASAWHVDMDQDVRCLMSVEPNARWYGTSMHELGHIYYFLEYSNDEVPVPLREGANRAFHEAVGSLAGLAAQQQPFLEGRGLIAEGAEPDPVQLLLSEALDMIVFIPFAAGVMSNFEHDLYSEPLSPDEFNARWWGYALQYQGIVPPDERGEEWADALTKTHINNDPAQYYDYALSSIILMQLHTHIANEILHMDPRATNYWGSVETGDFLKGILRPGATRDWRGLLLESTGSELTATPLLDYFSPLMAWLEAENAGREHTLPEI